MTDTNLNEGRESLFELDKEKTYLIEGNASGIYSTMKDDVSRYALSDVLIRTYDTTIQYAELPVVAFAQHINCIRKNEGMDYLDWAPGRRQYLVGKVEEYETKGVLRRSMKFYRDANICRELQVIEKRNRSLYNAWFSITDEERVVRMTKTLSLIERTAKMIETYYFVPWSPISELRNRLSKCKESVQQIGSLIVTNTSHYYKDGLETS
jgi:hypothetical protein